MRVIVAYIPGHFFANKPGLDKRLIFRAQLYFSHNKSFILTVELVYFEDMIARRPERVIEIAVKGMLPKGPLGRAMFRKLKVYAGNEHNHAAQQPQVLDI